MLTGNLDLFARGKEYLWYDKLWKDLKVMSDRSNIEMHHILIYIFYSRLDAFSNEAGSRKGWSDGSNDQWSQVWCKCCDVQITISVFIFSWVPSVDKRVDNDVLQLLHGRQAAAGECPGQPGSVRGRCVAVPLCPGGPGGRGGQTEVRGLAGLLSSHCPAPHLSPYCHQQSPATEDHRGQHHL